MKLDLAYTVPVSLPRIAFTAAALVLILAILWKRKLRGMAFVPFTDVVKGAAGDTFLCVDCTHPTARNLTHHRGSRTPPELKADTSGSIVLNAAKRRHPWLTAKRVTCNHFDADGLVAVYAATQPDDALRHEPLLRAIAHLGDFRELDLNSPDGRAALLFNLWVNSVERKRFYRPFHGSESDGAALKYSHFLPRTPAALRAAAEAAAAAGPGAATGLAALPAGSALAECALAECAEEFDAERAQVERGVRVLGGAAGAALADCARGVTRYEALGLAVARLPEPIHYYALFGATKGLDTVLSIFPNNRYEFEYKYTGYVELASRAAAPRMDLAPLAAALNARERAPGVRWAGCSIVDSGPLLRPSRDRPRAAAAATAAGGAGGGDGGGGEGGGAAGGGGGTGLTKAERYGHPFEREHVESSLQPDEVERIVVGFLCHGLGAAPRPKVGAQWREIHAVNAAVDWTAWRPEE